MVRKQGRPDLSAMLQGVDPSDKVIEDEKLRIEVVKPDLSEKIKRCYVITGIQLEKLMLLKTKKFRKNDLSEIVCMAIDSFFEKQMDGEG